uniref:Uncharacterized protein n=1 Tax=viral metagenome TaxID=1070528 RepID=A0A6H1ZVC5_9ZZZZ
MAHTAAIIPIEQVVSRFLFKYKRPLDDAFIYTEHCCNAYRDFRLYDSDQVVTAKVSINANKWIDMPSDLQTFVDLCTPISGEWWSFTEKRYIVNTTTFTGIVEGRDESFGEGADLSVPRTTGYAASGGVNDYNYMIDWEARRIYVDGMESATVVLLYTSSGIEMSGTTQVPELLTPLLDAYMLWKSSYWIPEMIRERQALEQDFTKVRLSTRNLINSMSYSAWRDLILSNARQAPTR